jgi:hypothetical protein
MPQFAQIDDYYMFTTGVHAPDDLPDVDVARLNSVLKRASNSVLRAVRRATIAWDRDTGMLRDAVIARGLADATCAQAAWFEEQGDVTGAAANINDISMGPVRIGRNATAAAAVSAADSRYAPEVTDILSGLPIWSVAVSHPGYF